MLEATVHEIIHILGFSTFAMQYWIDSATGSFYTSENTGKITKSVIIKGKQANLVFSRNILATARKYYGC